jgi:2-amino-4-hydroxy-6-hydroxymethyldihydropteridine diphosphokinase
LSVFLGLGSNVGDKEKHLAQACDRINTIERSSIIHVSSVYESEPWGRKDQDAFLNQVIEIKTNLKPGTFFAACQKIEKSMGRASSIRWGPRIIDIDLLIYHHRIIDDKGMQVPHPRLTQRRFVLVPLVEIAPHVIIPGVGKNTLEILQECEDSGKVIIYRKRSESLWRIPK